MPLDRTFRRFVRSPSARPLRGARRRRDAARRKLGAAAPRRGGHARLLAPLARVRSSATCSSTAAAHPRSSSSSTSRSRGPAGWKGSRLRALLLPALRCPWRAAVGAGRLLGGDGGPWLLPPLLAARPARGRGLATFGRMYALFLLCGARERRGSGIRAAASGSPRAWGSGGRRWRGCSSTYTRLRRSTRRSALLTGLRRAPGQPWRFSAPRAARARAHRRSGRGAAVRVRTRGARIPLPRRAGGRARLRQATAGRSVPEESLHALTPGGTAGALSARCSQSRGSSGSRGDRRPTAIALGRVARRAGRLLRASSPRRRGSSAATSFPRLPMLLLLVLTGCFPPLRPARPPPRRRWAIVLVGRPPGCRSKAEEDLSRLRRASRAAAAARAGRSRAGGTTCSSPRPGSPRADRPPELLDDYVALERPVGASRSRNCPPSTPATSAGWWAKGRAACRRLPGTAAARPRRAVWVFRGRPGAASTPRSGGSAGYDTVRASPKALVRSSRPGGSAGARPRGALAVREGLAGPRHELPADRWPPGCSSRSTGRRSLRVDLRDGSP